MQSQTANIRGMLGVMARCDGTILGEHSARLDPLQLS